jgi:replicative DNA helicase
MDQNEMKSHINRLEDDGFRVDLIIDDYLELMTPPRKYGDKRHELAATWEWFRAFINELKVPGWTATQGNRSSLSKEIISLQDIAEDISKAATADVIIALCQTYDESVSNRCRLFMAKVRDGESKGIIEAKFYGKQQSIITTGYVTKKNTGEKDV